MSGPQARPLLDRIEENYIPEPNSGCWLWIGQVNRRGYGVIGIGSRRDGTRRKALAHRVAWAIYRNREISPDELVCHRCDVPGCINPDHVFIGTQIDNMADASAKGRIHNKFNAGKTHCPQGHPYGDSRICSVCAAAARMRHYARNAEAIRQKRRERYWANPEKARAEALQSYHERKSKP